MSRAVGQLAWIGLALAVVACYLPWLWHPTAGLSPGAYDLAEWLSLHPVARASLPPLLPSFLLRAAFALLAMLFAAHAPQARQRAVRWGARLVALVLALTLFPPLEFLTVARGDGNYQQQFALGVATLVGVVGLVVWREVFSGQAEWGLIVCTTLLGAACGAWGLLEGQRGMASLGVSVAVGAGGILYLLSLGWLSVTNAVLRRAGTGSRGV